MTTFLYVPPFNEMRLQEYIKNLEAAVAWQHRQMEEMQKEIAYWREKNAMYNSVEEWAREQE